MWTRGWQSHACFAARTFPSFQSLPVALIIKIIFCIQRRGDYAYIYYEYSRNKVTVVTTAQCSQCNPATTVHYGNNGNVRAVIRMEPLVNGLRWILCLLKNTRVHVYLARCAPRDVRDVRDVRPRSCEAAERDSKWCYMHYASVHSSTNLVIWVMN